MRRRTAAILLPLAACRPQVALSVSTEAAPVFTVTGEDEPACLRSLAVYRRDGQLTWRIGQHVPTACATRVTYGTLPPGYEQIAPARALAAGQPYRVAITGPGFNDAAVFTASAVTPPSSAPAGPRSR